MVKLKLQCYCCGDMINGADIALVSMDTTAVGRVFVMKPTHVARVDHAHFVIVTRKVTEAPPTPA